MEKDVQNIDIVTCKLGLALIRISNHWLEITRKKKRKIEKIEKMV